MSELYPKMRTAYCGLAIFVGIFATLSMFIIFDYDIGIFQTVIIKDISFRFDPQTILTFLPFLIFPVYGIHCLRARPRHIDFLPATAFVIGIIALLMSIVTAMFDASILAVFHGILSAVIIVAAGSFRCGHVHSTTRILIIAAVYAISMLILATRVVLNTDVPITPLNLLIMAPTWILLFLIMLFFIPFCVYPNDFPGVRLSRQLSDVEHSMQNKPEILITEADLEILRDRRPEAWGPSENPAVDLCVPITASGGGANYRIIAEKWHGDDGIRITLSSIMPNAVNWGIGAKIIYIADDPTVSSPKGRVVRLYLDNGFFMRFVVCVEMPAVVGRYRSFIVKYLDN